VEVLVTVPKDVMFSTMALGLRPTNSGYRVLLSWEKVQQTSLNTQIYKEESCTSRPPVWLCDELLRHEV